jgi:sodium/pantothenate symporter
MSTVDSLLILASATLIKDVYVNYIRKGKKNAAEKDMGKKAASRVPAASMAITVILGLIVFVMALNPPDIIVWINLFALGGLEATFFWPLIGGLYWKKAHSGCCVASVIVGLAVFIFFNQVKIAPFGIHEIVLGLLAGGIAYFLAGVLIKREPDPEVLEKCF